MRTTFLCLVLAGGGCAIHAAADESLDAGSGTTGANDDLDAGPRGTHVDAGAAFVATGSTIVAADGTGDGTIDPTNPFFAALGTNGRSCGSCHVETNGWTVTPADLQARYTSSDGADPIFALVDGAVSPNADVSTPTAMRAAYNMLLTKAVIRIGLPIPSGADYTLDAVDDPYGFASATELSLFRRPSPTTNLRFVTQIMWDGREASLTSQATDAVLSHEAAAGTDAAQIAAAVAFESSLYTAESSDPVAGTLAGPTALLAQAFALGINDSAARTGFDPDVFTMYAVWNNVAGTDPASARQRSIARGEAIFDRRPFQITGVVGIPNGQGTCTVCHDTPNVGNHSVALPLDLGLSAAARRTPDLPLYTLRETSTGTTVQTTDPGRALVTGKFADVSKFRVPVLRGLGLRPPYFHNGSAPTLDAVVTFYDTRFHIGLSPQDHADLVAFLGAL